MKCPHCKQEMPEPLSDLPKLTVDTLEGIAVAVMKRDDFGVGRGAWTSGDNVSFEVAYREGGGEFVYKLVMPLGMVANVGREEFADRLALAQGSPASSAGEFGLE